MEKQFSRELLGVVFTPVHRQKIEEKAGGIIRNGVAMAC